MGILNMSNLCIFGDYKTLIFYMMTNNALSMNSYILFKKLLNYLWTKQKVCGIKRELHKISVVPRCVQCERNISLVNQWTINQRKTLFPDVSLTATSYRKCQMTSSFRDCRVVFFFFIYIHIYKLSKSFFRSF